MCSTPGNAPEGVDIIQPIVFAILQYIESRCTFLQGLLKNRDNFTDEMIEAYIYTFSQPGALTAALNYYRCIFKRPKNMKRSSKLLEMPILVIWVSTVHVL